MTSIHAGALTKGMVIISDEGLFKVTDLTRHNEGETHLVLENQINGHTHERRLLDDTWLSVQDPGRNTQ